MAEEDTPIVECRHIVSEDDNVVASGGVTIPANKRLEEGGGDMSQSYHEIFDSQVNTVF